MAGDTGPNTERTAVGAFECLSAMIVRRLVRIVLPRRGLRSGWWVRPAVRKVRPPAFP